MTKIMLVEDDNNLREIYEARLAAEGYTIVSAEDGEAALALAAREHPDLVITDVMMPKISGFEMLDILRNTEALRDVKVIMLTALGQAEDNARADALGADRYLVKSQVTLEDIIKATHDVLADPQATATESITSAPTPMDSTPTYVAADAPAIPDVAPAAAPLHEVPEASDATPQAQPWQVDQQSQETPEQEVHEPELSVESAVPDAPVSFEAPVEPIVPEDVSAPTETVQTFDFSQYNSPPPAPQLDLPAVPDASAPPLATTTNDDTEDNAPSTNNLPANDTTTASDTVAAASVTEEQEESVMRAQIDQFVDTADSAPVEAFTTSTLPEEPESEFQKDLASPDMGQLSVHSDADAQPTDIQPSATVPTDVNSPVATEAIEPESAQPELTESLPAESQTVEPQNAAMQPVVAEEPTPGYPSYAYQLPVTPEAAVQTNEQPTDQPNQSVPTAGDQLVSNAINDMIASTPQSQPYVSPQSAMPEPVPADENVPADSEDQPTAQPPLAQPTATAQPESYDMPAPVAHKRVISPIGFPSRPDINQLLAMEDAKTAATQAGVYSQSTQPAAAAPQQEQLPPQPQPEPQPLAPGQDWQKPFQQPQPVQRPTSGPVDPNSISL